MLNPQLLCEELISVITKVVLNVNIKIIVKMRFPFYCGLAAFLILVGDQASLTKALKLQPPNSEPQASTVTRLEDKKKVASSPAAQSSVKTKDKKAAAPAAAKSSVKAEDKKVAAPAVAKSMADTEDKKVVAPPDKVVVI